jgi:hypothetical protein
VANLPSSVFFFSLLSCSFNFIYINKLRYYFPVAFFSPFPPLVRIDSALSIIPLIAMDEKNGSPTASAVESVKAGHVSGIKKRFGFSLEVRQEESSFAATKNASNADFDPIPPSKRTWNWGAYVAYWMADAWAVSNWEVGKCPAMCFTCRITQSPGANALAVQLPP